MDETMETSVDVVETEPELIEDEYEDDSDDISAIPFLVGGGIVAGVIALAANRKRISAWIDEKQKERFVKYGEKHGMSYITIEDSNDSDAESK